MLRVTTASSSRGRREPRIKSAQLSRSASFDELLSDRASGRPQEQPSGAHLPAAQVRDRGVDQLLPVLGRLQVREHAGPVAP